MDTIKSRAQIQKLLMVLSLSVFLSLLFSFFQKYGSLRTGNTPYWVLLHQMNATFKDPNSFAGFLAAFFPLLLGLHFSFRRRGKLLSWLLMALVFFVFPWLGARSAFLAILVSLAVFLILALISAPKILNKKYIPFILVSGLLFLGVFSFFILSKESRLWQRLGWSFSVFSQKISWTEFLSHRRYFWNSALYMIKDYPLTGVGIGAYIIELPNYLFLHRLHFASTDSALNYAFQVGSEFGLVGLIVVFWLIMEIVRTIKRAWWTTKDDLKNRMLLIGAVSGLSAFFVNFFFHTYIGSFEMKYFLWLIIATICFLSRPEIKGDSDHPANRRFSRAAICLTLVFGIILLWNSTHSLSLSRRAGKLGWNQYFGLYEIERNQQGLYFQWAKKTSGITLENLGPTLVIPMTASHPDLQKNPVQVKIFLANQNFRIKKLLQEVWMQKPGWIQCEFPVAQFQERTIQLVFKTDRAWQPLKDLKIHDPRRLAIGLGEFWFRYPADVPAEKIHAVHKISAEAWEGTQKANLFSPGSSRIRFRSESRNVAIRLWAKGQKAFDIGPYLVIKLDDTTIGKTMLDQDGWLSLILQAEINEGDHILSVEFTNDIHDPKKGQDRNVFLGDVEILSLKNP
jgi:O-antigen ligase